MGDEIFEIREEAIRRVHKADCLTRGWTFETKDMLMFSIDKDDGVRAYLDAEFSPKSSVLGFLGLGRNGDLYDLIEMDESSKDESSLEQWVKGKLKGQPFRDLFAIANIPFKDKTWFNRFSKWDLAKLTTLMKIIAEHAQSIVEAHCVKKVHKINDLPEGELCWKP